MSMVTIRMRANQEIHIQGELVNINDLASIMVDDNGVIVAFTKSTVSDALFTAGSKKCSHPIGYADCHALNGDECMNGFVCNVPV